MQHAEMADFTLRCSSMTSLEIAEKLPAKTAKLRKRSRFGLG